MDAFRDVALNLTLKPDSTHYGSLFEVSDLTARAGWAEADETTRGRIVTAASSYLAGYDPGIERWLDTSEFRVDLALGYQALRLLDRAKADHLSKVPLAVWQKCGPTMLAYPLNPGDEDKRLFIRVYRVTPDPILNALVRLLERDTQGRGLYLSRVEPLWDSRLEDCFLSILKNPDHGPWKFGQLLEALIGHGSAEAILLARSWIRADLTESDARDRAVCSAAALVSSGGLGAWETAWPVVLSDKAFGVGLFTRIASGMEPRNSAFIESLSDVLDGAAGET